MFKDHVVKGVSCHFIILFLLLLCFIHLVDHYIRDAVYATKIIVVYLRYFK